MAELPVRAAEPRTGGPRPGDGLLVSAWTVDTRRTMRRLLAFGVDSITTNRIDALRAQLANSPFRGAA